MNIERNSDLSSCNSPVHLIGQIQPHGYLIALDVTSHLIKYISKNIKSLLGFNAEKLINKRLKQVLDDHPLVFHVEDILNRREEIYGNFQLSSYTSTEGIEYLAIGYFSDNYLVIEFEPSENIYGLERSQAWFDNATVQLRSTKTLNQILQETLEELKSIINYDRLLVYKFHEDGHGEVVAEAKETHLEPYLGLHYPASDIPTNARELYTKNWSRLTVDVNESQVDILSTEESPPLDLTLSRIRSMHPCCREYLQNMGVDSLMTISIIHNNKLWGMLTCHHYLPKFIGYHRRNTAQLFGRLLSLIIPLKEEEEYSEILSRNDKLLDNIFANTKSVEDFFQSIKNETITFLNSTHSCGVAFNVDNQIIQVGQCPSLDLITAIHTQLILKEDKVSCVTEDNLTNWIKANLKSDSYDLVGCHGFLFAAIPDVNEGSIIFFRSEYKHTIRWAGNPNGDILDIDSNKLSPRLSFNLFLEEIKNKAKAWSTDEIQLKENFIKKFRDEIIKYQSVELKKKSSILDTVYNISMDSLLLVDQTDHTIIDCNERATTFFKTDNKSSLIGRSFFNNSLLEFYLDKINFTEALNNNIEFEAKIKFTTATKQSIWGTLKAKPIEKQNLDLYLVRIVEITDLIEAQQMLNDQNTELQKLNKELDYFVYSSSHDLRAPIATMIGLVDIVRDMKLPEEANELLDAGKKSLETLDILIKDILKYSRNTRQSIQIESIELKKEVADIIAQHHIQRQSDIDIQIEIGEQHYVNSDLYRLKVILNNIISNAFKYRNHDINNSFIKISAIESDNIHTIVIEDNGIGIMESQLNKIFEMFHRSSVQSVGSGLGLYIAKEMAIKIQANIEVISTVNKGTTFTVEIPDLVGKNTIIPSNLIP